MFYVLCISTLAAWANTSLHKRHRVNLGLGIGRRFSGCCQRVLGLWSKVLILLTRLKRLHLLCWLTTNAGLLTYSMIHRMLPSFYSFFMTGQAFFVSANFHADEKHESIKRLCIDQLENSFPPIRTKYHQAISYCKFLRP